VDHTLRLIQHNSVVLDYNFNVLILVLIIGESSISATSACHFITVLSLLLPCIIILFLHLLSTKDKSTQPCYFPLLLKPAAQKEKMDWNSLTKSSRLRVARLPFLWSYLVFRCSVSLRVVIVFGDIIYAVIILYL
jgi:hypothetical protein